MLDFICMGLVYLSRSADVILKSDPVEKWLPGSFFNVKIWHGSKFNIKSWTKGREKVTPPMKFWPPMGGGVIFQRFLQIENKFVYPRQRSYGSILVSPWLSVHLSVGLRKKWFLYNISSSIWHTMMILHIYVDLDLRRTSFDFGSKVKGQICTLTVLPFPHHSSFSFFHTIMILHRCIDLDLRKLNLCFNFSTKRDWTFILHILVCIPCGMTFLIKPQVLTSWPWPWLFTYFWNKRVRTETY